MDRIGAASGGDPGEAAGYGLFEVPLLVLFELVMVPAQRTEVATAGRAILIERPGVIGVASPGRLATRRKPAGQVPQAHELAEPGRHLVGRAGLGVSTSSGSSIGFSSLGCLGDCFAGSRDDRREHCPQITTLPLTAARSHATALPLTAARTHITAHPLITARLHATTLFVATTNCGAEVVCGHDHRDGTEKAAGIRWPSPGGTAGGGSTFAGWPNWSGGSGA